MTPRSLPLLLRQMMGHRGDWGRGPRRIRPITLGDFFLCQRWHVCDSEVLFQYHSNRSPFSCIFSTVIDGPAPPAIIVEHAHCHLRMMWNRNPVLSLIVVLVNCVFRYPLRCVSPVRELALKDSGDRFSPPEISQTDWPSLGQIIAER
ncbi:hypothetical protein DQ04_03691050 [Trypanosoma grayi]|uniref:hypothetical protein n=1 Tax=Trypanosoma grayi TaxID=71804 RepID=UPI0004F486FF|nr:hypothetical protein DQ04_03691050 [Trypanosoma grayi]KEG10460.1 hypothetical protein DQ04_03691050 [Trypanosoma grayi]